MYSHDEPFGTITGILPVPATLDALIPEDDPFGVICALPTPKALYRLLPADAFTPLPPFEPWWTSTEPLQYTPSFFKRHAPAFVFGGLLAGMLGLAILKEQGIYDPVAYREPRSATVAAASQLPIASKEYAPLVNALSTTTTTAYAAPATTQVPETIVAKLPSALSRTPSFWFEPGRVIVANAPDDQLQLAINDGRSTKRLALDAPVRHNGVAVYSVTLGSYAGSGWAALASSSKPNEYYGSVRGDLRSILKLGPESIRSQTMLSSESFFLQESSRPTMTHALPEPIPASTKTSVWPPVRRN